MKFLIVIVAAFATAMATSYNYGPSEGHKYQGPPAQITVLPSGFLADTPEVAQAKSAHLAEKSKIPSEPAYAPAPFAYAPAPSAYAPAPSAYAPAPASYFKPAPSSYSAPAPVSYSAPAPVSYSAPAPVSYSAPAPASYFAPAPAPVGPVAYLTKAPVLYSAPSYAAKFESYAPAKITVLPSGFLADTPEVAEAKSAHLAEKAKSASQSVYAPAPVYSTPAPVYYSTPAPAYYASPAPSYSAPSYYAGKQEYAPAQISVLPSGFLADTPEVAQAKSAHLAEKSKVAASPEYRSYSEPSYEHSAPSSYSHY